MSSIKDVAKRAGVSIGTVSNVFNDSPRVKDITKAKVLKAAAELNYNGLNASDNGHSREGRVIGVIAEDLSIFNAPEIIQAICRSANEKGWEILIYNLGLIATSGTYDFDELECAAQAKNAVNLLLSKDVSGIIYVGCQSREIKYLSAGYASPFVYAYCYSHVNNAPSLVYDDENISYELTRHLLENGHANIGIISGQEDNIHARNRVVGFQKAHYDAGILYNPNNILRGNWNDPVTGYNCIPQLLDNKITAVYCMNDVIAVGVYDYALSHGIKIPEELSVVGFDNQQISNVLYPRLTTVALPLCEIGVQAVEQMDRVMKGKDLCEPNIITLGCNIIFRDSVANLRVLK